MRYIGNKEKLLANIYDAVLSTGVNSGSFCDFFAGTASVGRFFKSRGFSVVSADLLYSSYVLQKAYVENNEEPEFNGLYNAGIIGAGGFAQSRLEVVLDKLNSQPGISGFIFRNYTEDGTKDDEVQRMFFTPQNGQRIDAIRTTIENWNNDGLLKENEYFILLAALVESVPFYANISGVYGAFLKQYDPRALKKFVIRPIQIYKSHLRHSAHNVNSMDMAKKLDVDILYLDPPYNQRQYGSNYHLVETIAKYDAPEIYGVAGLRNYSEQKSEFCNAKTALAALEKIASTAKYRYLILSYNSEGIMPTEEIMKVLGRAGSCKLVGVDYRRFRSNSNGESKTKKTIQEQLFILENPRIKTPGSFGTLQSRPMVAAKMVC